VYVQEVVREMGRLAPAVMRVIITPSRFQSSGEFAAHMIDEETCACFMSWRERHTDSKIE